MIATAIRVKSQLRKNITTSMPRMVNMSTTMPSVAEEAKFWMVSTSAVIVLSSTPDW